MSLLRPTLIVGGASIGARLLGFARDVLFAQVFGAGMVADAFLAAFRFLDLVRRVVGEGGLNPALVPLLAGLKREEAARLTGEILVAAGLLLLGLTVLVEAAAGLVMEGLAPGLAEEPGALALAAHYCRLSWPLVIGAVLAALGGAALNAGGRFAAASVAPLTVGVTMVAVLLVLRGSDTPAEEAAAGLAAALSLAGAVQAGIVIAAARRGRMLRWGSPFRSAALASFLRKGPPLALASAAPHLFIIVGTQVASFWPSGVSRLFYADRIAYLATALVATVAGAVLLPVLARHHQAGRREALLAAQNRAVELALLVAMPAGVALAVLAEPVMGVLFQRGAFDLADTRATAQILVGLGIGVPVVTLGKVLAQTVFAQGAARAALTAAAGGLAVTAGGTLLLGGLLDFLGLGLGLSLGAVAHLALLLGFLKRSDLWAPDRRLRERSARIILASALMGGALSGGLVLFGPPGHVAMLGAFCLGGAAFYGAAAWALGALKGEDLARLRAKNDEGPACAPGPPLP